MDKLYILSEGFYDRAEKHVGLFSSFEKAMETARTELKEMFEVKDDIIKRFAPETMTVSHSYENETEDIEINFVKETEIFSFLREDDMDFLYIEPYELDSGLAEYQEQKP